MPAYAQKNIDHAAYPRLCRRRSDAELLFVIADARAAHDANPENPNAGYYLDEISYCADELARRARGGRRQRPTAADGIRPDLGGIVGQTSVSYRAGDSIARNQWKYPGRGREA